MRRLAVAGPIAVSIGAIGVLAADGIARADPMPAARGDGATATVKPARACFAQPAGKKRLKRRVFKRSLRVRRGTKRFKATTVEIKRDLLLAKNARIAGTGSKLVLIVRGDLKIAGKIESAGDLVLVSSPARVPRQRANAKAACPGVRAARARKASKKRAPRSRWVISGKLTAGQVEAATARPANSHKGKSGERGGSVVVKPTDTMLDLIGIRVSPGSGGDGQDMVDCGKEGGDGGGGGNLWVEATDIVTRHGTVFVGGNGGSGGDAKVDEKDCPDGTLNVGGTGGSPGFFSVHAHGALTTRGPVLIRGWNGGRGGDAQLRGAAGHPRGASVTAIGGPGGEFADSGFFFRFGGNRFDLRNPNEVAFDTGVGGRGGDAKATGGNGLPWTECANFLPTGVGGDGGNGVANGGNGGALKVDSNSSAGSGELRVTLIASIRAGSGGSADASGGHGGRGADCGDRGGDGGGGGNAQATRGESGAVVSPRDGHLGIYGAQNSLGGDGGCGGNALFVPGGTPGAGGPAGTPNGKPGLAGGTGQPPAPEPTCPP